MRIICAVELKLLNQVSDPEELYDRMCAYWMNIGVVGALLGAVLWAVSWRVLVSALWGQCREQCCGQG